MLNHHNVIECVDAINAAAGKARGWPKAEYVCEGNQAVVSMTGETAPTEHLGWLEVFLRMTTGAKTVETQAGNGKTTFTIKG